MPSIYLKQTAPYNNGSVSVACESYSPSNLFTRYKHTFTSAATGKIYIYKGKGIGLGGFIITTDGTHQSAKLKEAYVYVNKYDDKNTPLIFVLKFNGGAGAENKYYTRSDFKGKFSDSETVQISSLQKYDNDTSILTSLLAENDKLDTILTYNIGRTSGEAGNGNGTYNGGKICVQVDSTSEPKLTDGFKKYKHTPEHSHGTKKACVIFDKNVLLQQDKDELSGIQNQEYESIRVYYGSKAKKTSSTSGAGQGLSDTYPLLIELTKTNPPGDQPDYYVHKRSGTKYYWEKLPVDSATNTLKGLLEDMGFGFKNGEPGYKELHRILQGAGVSGIIDGYTGELSDKLKDVTGSKLQDLLKQTVGQGGGDSVGSSPKLFLQLLLTQIEFDLLDSVVILLDKKPSDSQYGESDVSGVVGQLQPKRDINRIKMNGGGSKNIQVSNATTSKGQCVQDYGYKLISHNFSTLVSSLSSSGQSSVAIRFIIPSEKGSNEYKQLKLYDKDNSYPQNLQYTYYNSRDKDVYVYFYGEKDPRPLLVCYNDCAYKPRKQKPDKENQVKVNYTQWHKVKTIRNCVCTGADTSPGTPNQEILKALNEVTGFLNPVQINPKEIPDGACRTITASETTTNYELHKYIPGKTIKMGISCTKVECYDKYTYQPYGLNGHGTSQRAEGFRLGTVLHTKSGSSSTRNTLNYTTLSNTYKYHPLVGVTVYYYDADKGYDDPLLIELEFKTNGGAGAGPKEYYKLQAAGDGSNGTLTWQLDGAPKTAVSSPGDGADNQKLIEHLDSIRHSLKKVVKILIDKTGQYPLNLSKELGTGASTYSQNGGSTNIEVKACDDEPGCNQLATLNYKCYQHKVSKLNSQFDYNTIGGLKFYISGKNGEGAGGGDKDIPIPLYSESGSPLTELLYNTCMKDIYVFFYCKNGGDENCTSSTKPTAPLMLYYNKGYYKPADIDQYFTKWVCEKGLESVISQKPCGDNNGGPTKLATKLNDVNRALNRIRLTETSGLSTSSGTSQYGISKPSGPPNDPNIELNRIHVTKIPGEPPETRPYCKLVHRTMNSFDIGDIYYKDQNITSGLKINNGSGPGGTIKLDGGGTNHTTSFLNGTGENKPNTVVAYYHKDDSAHKLPQLIVLLQTEGEILESSTITAKAQTKYGYYVLATKGTSGDYQYEWRTPGDTGTTLTLDEKTEFQLLNSIIILVDKQGEYNEGVINSAVTTAKIKSPGNLEGVNRLQNRNISVDDKTTDNGKCVSKYGYKLFEHDLTKATAEIHGINPILGLRFLIPGKKSENEYKQLTLYQKEETQPQNIEYIYFDGTNKTLYIYFYGEDPRPLLLCYNKKAYIPQKLKDPTQLKQVDVDYLKWTKAVGITKCTCTGKGTESPNKEILETLLKVVLFLNPVQINPRKLPTLATAVITAEFPKPPGKNNRDITYRLHKFTTSKTLKMKITRTDVGCYDKYTYQPVGTGSGGTGFRLGSVHYSPSSYSTKFNKLDYNSPTSQYKNHPLVQATVFYYDHDKQYEDPLLIELEFNTNGGAVGGASNPKEYYKLKALIKTDGTGMDWELDPYAQTHIGKCEQEKLINYLDTIRYQFKKVLEIKIAIKQETHYSAKLLDRDTDKPVEPNQQIQVSVSEESTSGSLTGTGFRCFKHNITGLGSPNLHKFAALHFFIPDKDSTKLVKLNLHESSKSKPIEPLYYNCGMGDIYVYFYGGDGQGDGDPRPLLLCYNNKPFRASSIDTYDIHKWINPKALKDCTSPLNGLIRVSNFLNPVWINKTSGTYNIHKFNGQQISIKVTETPGLGGFCYHKYTHTHNGTGSGGVGFRLGKIEYNNHCIREEKDSDKCITSLTSHKPNYDPASEVVVYYYKGDPNHQNPLLVVLCKTANGASHNGAGNTCTYQPYYELQKSSTKTDKKYTKHSSDLSLDPTKGGQLEKILDRILFNISKRLQILLGQRPDPIKLCPSKRLRFNSKIASKPCHKPNEIELGYQLVSDIVFDAAEIAQSILTQDSLFHKDTDSSKKKIFKNCEQRLPTESNPKIKTRTPSYPARVYNNTGKRESGDSGSTLIKVQKIESKELTNTGYICYRHLLTEIKDIDNFGGLRLFLWDNRHDSDDSDCKPTPPNHLSKHKCCELDLYENGSQPSGTCSTSKIDPIAYTTCKGDLYVYFYGSDPRPMLLCYNGQSYAPQSMDEYNQKWCLVKTITSCECGDKGLTDPSSVLQQLYHISMFLNPVNLWETMEAYKKVKDVIEISYLLFIIFSYLYTILSIQPTIYTLLSH